MGKTFCHASKVLPWPGLRGAELLAIYDKVCPGLAQGGQIFHHMLKVLRWSGPGWAKHLAAYQKFCPGLAQDEQNFKLYATIYASAGPKVGAFFSHIHKVLPWSGPRWAELLVIHDKFSLGLAQDRQNFLQ